jgi:hypothetical protein
MEPIQRHQVVAGLFEDVQVFLDRFRPLLPFRQLVHGSEAIGRGAAFARQADSWGQALGLGGSGKSSSDYKQIKKPSPGAEIHDDAL